MSSATTNETEIALQVIESQVYQLYRQTKGGLAGTLLVAVVDVVALWSVIPAWKLLVWLGGMCAIIVIRLLTIFVFQRSQPTGFQVYTWGRIHVAGAIGAALIWGAPAIFLWPANDPVHQMVWPICIVAITASAVAMYSVWPPSYICFLLLSVVPISMRMLIDGGLTYVALGFLGLVFTAILAQTGNVMNRASRQTLEVSIRNRALNEQLSKEITERQKSQQQLFKANQIAEEASRAKSQFLANMSHEIRTPLNGVIGIVSLLKESNLDASQRLYIDSLQASSMSLLTVIEDILDFSKIEAGKIDLQDVDFNLYELLDGIVDVMSPKVNELRLDLICSIPSETPVNLIGDPGRLRQIFLNLVSNGIKFTEEGEVEISIECLHQSEKNVEMLISVRDTGIGIPADIQGKLFESFTQADISTTKKFGGTGLGLAISKALVEFMGGEIGLESKTGEGTLFWVKVALKKQEEDLPKTHLSENLAGMQCMVIDDNTTCREMLSRRLNEWGADVIKASGKAETLDLLNTLYAEGNEVNVIFIDMDLGETDGVSLGKEIEACKYFPDVKMILMQPFADIPDESFNRQDLFFACIQKPIRYGNLLDTVKLLFTGQSIIDNSISTIVPADVQERVRSHATILLAEDNKINQLVIKGMLKNMGYTHVDTVNNGNDAIAALRQKQYDLVLMDIQMPQLDGMETTREIRSGTVGDDAVGVPIIALTANAMKGDEEKYLALGMNGYITKPVNPDVLKASIENSIHPKRDIL